MTDLAKLIEVSAYAFLAYLSLHHGKMPEAESYWVLAVLSAMYRPEFRL